MNELFYEKKQNLNRITRYLHSGRYKQLTSFVRKNFKGELKILDIGCGPGGAYNALKDHTNLQYHGVDIREDFIAAATQRHPEASFDVDDVTRPDFDFGSYNLIIALETFEHIPEGLLVKTLEKIALESDAHVLASVPIEIGPSVAIKNLGARLMGYNRNSGNFMETLNAATYQLNKVPTHDTAHLGFNWYWLEQTLRHNFIIDKSASLPISWLPKWIAPTVMFYCSPKTKY